MAKISLLFVLALLSFKDTSKHAVLRTEIETNVTTSGCLFYNSGFGGGFFFYPNTSIANLNEILSNEYNYIGFRLFLYAMTFCFLIITTLISQLFLRQVPQGQPLMAGKEFILQR